MPQEIPAAPSRGPPQELPAARGNAREAWQLQVLPSPPGCSCLLVLMDPEGSQKSRYQTTLAPALMNLSIRSQSMAYLKLISSDPPIFSHILRLQNKCLLRKVIHPLGGLHYRAEAIPTCRSLCLDHQLGHDGRKSRPLPDARRRIWPHSSSNLVEADRRNSNRPLFHRSFL